MRYRYINCNKANLHILVNNQNTQAVFEDLVYCWECCENRTEEQLANGWICDECDYNISDDDSIDDEPQYNEPPDG